MSHVSGYDTVFGHARSTSTGTVYNRYRPTSSENSIRYKPEVKTLPQTGSNNNFATKTNINAISVAIPSGVATGCAGCAVHKGPRHSGAPTARRDFARL